MLFKNWIYSLLVSSSVDYMFNSYQSCKLKYWKEIISRFVFAHFKKLKTNLIMF